MVSDLAGSGAGEGFGVSRIFLSHSSADNRAAAALKRRQAAQRPELVSEMIFLDIDPGSGRQLGSRWKRQLFKSTSRGAVQHRRAVSV